MAQSYRGTARLSSNVYFFQHAGARLLPGPHTMWGVLKPGASAAKNLVNRSKVVARRTTAHHAVHTNVKVLSLNPHGPPDWWVDNKKAACEEKILSVPATDPK
jgi:hypothetical protein